jgi:hypothetical protein
MSKALRVAGEVDSFCTKCRLLLNHRIISMKGAKAYQVECLTCHGNHLYRAAAPGERAAAGAAARASSGAARPARVSSGTRAEQARVAREQSWEKAIAGRGMAEFKSYAVSLLLEEGDLVRHKKFGDGIVTRVIDANKVEVLFKDEPRTLAQGLT